jgi:hypothetical protein
MMSDAKVVPFRKRALSPPAALKYLRDLSTDGLFETESYSTLATLLGWNRSQAWKAVARWQKSGKLVVESGADDARLVLRIPPDRRALVRGKGAGVAAPKRGIGKRKKGTGGVPTGGPESVPAGTLETSPPDMHEGASLVARSNDNSKTYANHEIFSNAPDVAFEKPVEAPPVSAGNTSVYAEVAERFPPVSTEPHRVEPTPHLPTDGRVVARPKGGGGGPIAPIQVNRRVGVWTLIAALVMAGFSTVLTVMGFAVLLPGWLMLSMGLGAATEFGRLVVVGKATRSWHDLNGLLRCGAVLYIVLAESVSLIGVYSELHNLHTGNRPEATAAVEQDKASTAAKVEYQRGVISDLDTQIGNVDRNSGSLIAADAKRGRVKDGKSLIGASDKQRAPLVEQRKQAAAQLATLQGEAARATGRGAMIDAEVSQVKQVAALLGVDPGDALRWWLLAITILIGPCASLLIAMATHGGRRA